MVNDLARQGLSSSRRHRLPALSCPRVRGQGPRRAERPNNDTAARGHGTMGWRAIVNSPEHQRLVSWVEVHE